MRLLDLIKTEYACMCVHIRVGGCISNLLDLKDVLHHHLFEDAAPRKKKVCSLCNQGDPFTKKP